MAKNKNSFLLYCDLIHTVEKMPNEKAGELFKHILLYVNDKNPTSEDLIINLTFEPIKQSLKRDLVKYEAIRQRNILNIEKRWNDTKNTNGKNGIPNNTKNTVSDIVSDSDNNINSRKLKFSETLKPFLEKYGKEMLNNFYAYWTEPNKSKTKLRFENEKFWDLNKRLATWDKNNFNNKNQQSSTMPNMIYY